MPAKEETEDIIQVDHLVKRYRRGKINAVDDVTFTVRRGETFGLLGPNGAGKTTTIGILMTAVFPDSGTAKISGIDVVDNPIGVKQRLAVVPQRNNLDRSLHVDEILTYHAAYHGVPKAERMARANTLLEELGLNERRHEKLGWFSGGMEQRVMLARALMHEPEVLFLDEPTNNLDPQSRLFLWERIRTLRERGVTTILTTHDMEEADRLCDRIAIMDRGRILALDTPEGLKRLIPGGTMLELSMRSPSMVNVVAGIQDGSGVFQAEHFREVLARLPGVTKVEQLAGKTDIEGQAETFSFRLFADSDPGTILASAAQAVIQDQGELLDLRFTKPSLEDVFIYLTGRKLRA
ncbi:MAG TPA: ABC transporter ATP-binding protein [Ktedonobacteraceae bacterium]|nr:ABC transporter ATP-binding protein [Ktedonobacteraceae bacterium]